MTLRSSSPIALLFFILIAALVAPSLLAGETFTLTEEEQEIMDRTNVERKKEGLGVLKPNPTLFKAARNHSKNMATKEELAHTLDGKSSADRVTDLGYDYSAVAENVAWNQKTPEAVVESWMKSPGHRKNIMNGEYLEIGVGVARTANGEPYYTQVFGRALAADPMKNANFTITNRTAFPITVHLPGGSVSTLRPNGKGQYMVGSTGEFPKLKVEASDSTRELQVKDGVDFVIHPQPSAPREGERVRSAQ